MNFLTFMLFFLLATSAACGSSGSQDAGVATDTQQLAREVSVTILPKNNGENNEVRSEETQDSTQVSACLGISKAIIVDSEGKKESETLVEKKESGEECIARLPLEIGKPYSIVFVDAQGCYIATLAAPDGGIIKLPEVQGNIDLGSISISSNNLVMPLYVHCSLPEPVKKEKECEENSACPPDPCDFFYSCENSGLGPAGDDGLCAPIREYLEANQCQQKQ